jgi:hypothetical protein
MDLSPFPRPDSGLARWGLARRDGLDPSHPEFVTSEALILNHAAQVGRRADEALFYQPIAVAGAIPSIAPVHAVVHCLRL